MEQALYLVLGAALTWAFYFVQRRVERRPDVEAIDRHEKLLALKQGMERADVSLDISDAQMQERAAQAFEAADARLRALVAHLRAQLDGEALATFEHAHATWLELRERYAAFIAASYAGGGIRPLIHAVTLEGITLGWIAELETQLGNGEDDLEGDELAEG